jgi:hypothetical protein
MTDTLPNLRYERKFLAGALSSAAVLSVVRRHPALFRETYPARLVNSLYLDTPGRNDYFDHVNGAPQRVKTRIRWYGPLTGHHEGLMLERKFRSGLVSGKTVTPLPPLTVNGGLAPADLKAALDDAGLREMLRMTLRHFEPAVVIRYHRQYFLSADGGFRLTVDSQLQFAGMHPGTGALTRLTDVVHPVIVELKYGPPDAENAAAVTNAFPFRMKRCSKYVIGIECLPPALSPVAAVGM